MSTAPSDALLSRLPERPADDGPTWLQGLRDRAASTLREQGFPTKKHEAWKFTPVRPITSVPFAPAPAEHLQQVDREGVRARLGDDPSWQVMLVDGRPALQAAGRAPEGVEVHGLADLLTREPDRVEPHLGKHVTSQHFVALNAAMFEDGLVLRVGRNVQVEQPVHIVHVGVPGEAPTAAHPRVLVQLEEGARLSLVETFLVREGEKHLTNVVSEMVVGDNARLDHVRMHEPSDNGYHVAMTAVHQGRDSRYDSHVVTFGSPLFRLDLDVKLAGQGAECNLDGAYHATGREHVDHQTRVEHAVPHCTSNQSYRGILDGRAQGVYDGTVIVPRDAQHTSAHQENRNLLLSDEAGIHTKPHLQIDADDVKCSHGATIGSLDRAQLHYLRARGIGAAHARAILTYAFLRSVIERVPGTALRGRIERALLDRLPHGDEVRELSSFGDGS